MTVSIDSVGLGTIICDKCGILLDAVDSEKVTVYYSRCNKKPCTNQESSQS